MDVRCANLDLLRREHRLFLVPEAEAALLASLGRDWKEVHFSDRPHVLTVYLESDEHDVPFGTSVKLRQFLPAAPRKPAAVWDEPFRFEVKGTRRESERQKTAPRFLSIERAVREARRQFSITPLRPYLAVGYERRHFVPLDGSPLRFTVDRDVRYWYLTGNGVEAVSLGEERLLRLEIKAPVADGSDLPVLAALRAVLADAGALPINSKRNEGFARIGQYLEDRFGSGVEHDLPGYEIEAKLLVRADDPTHVFRFLRACMSHDTRPLCLTPSFPFTIDAEAVNQYWAEGVGGRPVEGLKLLLRGDHFGTVQKSETMVLDRTYGIVRRREVKTPAIPYTPAAYRAALDGWLAAAVAPRFAGYLVRWRRAVWPVEISSQRVYHVSLDRCVSAGRTPLWQVEIEYVGRLAGGAPSPDLEAAAVGDIRHLVRRLLERANRKGRGWLEPTTLTKFAWLLGP